MKRGRRTSSRAAARLTAFDLFCGAGGLSEGLRQAGFEVVGAVDSDALAIEAFGLNHTEAHVWEGDVQKLDPSAVRTKLDLKPGQLDLLAGCPPCQGFSSMRTLNGHVSVEDVQNDLVFEFVRFARALRPRALMMENVPGLASDARMIVARKELRELGYELRDDVLQVADYGVPQRRRRYILIGLRNGKPFFGRRAQRKRTVRGTISSRPEAGSSGDKLHDLTERRSEVVRERIAAIPTDGGSRDALPDHLQLSCHKGFDGFKDVYGRMSWDQPAPTITGGCVNPSRGRFLHPEENRSITLREAALLQSFRPAYRFPLSEGKFAAAQLIGNALPPRFARSHALALKSSLLRQRALGDG